MSANCYRSLLPRVHGCRFTQMLAATQIQSLHSDLQCLRRQHRRTRRSCIKIHQCLIAVEAAQAEQEGRHNASPFIWYAGSSLTPRLVRSPTEYTLDMTAMPYARCKTLLLTCCAISCDSAAAKPTCFTCMKYSLHVASLHTTHNHCVPWNGGHFPVRQ